MFKPQPKLQQQNKGFTLVEVLVAILLTTLFVGVAMQAVVIATVFKARARKFAEATIWIQEDLEKVKNEAAKFQSTSLTSLANEGSSLITVASVDGFVQYDTLKVGTDPTIYTISTTSEIASTITITQPLKKYQSQGAAVVETTVFPYTSLKSAANSGTTVLQVSSVNGFVIGDTLTVGTDATNNLISNINPSASPPTLTLSSPGLGTVQSKGAVVVKNTRCNPAVGSQNIGFAKLLWDKLLADVPLSAANPNNIVKNIVNKPYILTRTLNYRLDSSGNPIHPYNVLTLNYTVIPQSGGSAVATMNTEVIPDAVFQCTPQ
jgi:prepilin-type N-terminal cleavage/methylation domain-containing protein